MPSCSAGGVGHQRMGTGASPSPKQWRSGRQSSTLSGGKQLPLRGKASREEKLLLGEYVRALLGKDGA